MSSESRSPSQAPSAPTSEAATDAEAGVAADFSPELTSEYRPELTAEFRPARGTAQRASPPPGLSADQEQALLSALVSSEERTRFQALLTLGELKKEAEKRGPVDFDTLVSVRLFSAVEKLLNDPSRQVREQVRHLGPFTVAARAARLQEEAPSLSAEQVSPPRPMMALVSFGSSATGLLAVGLSVMHYYAMGYFPFPEPLEVLLFVMVALVLPFVVVGGLLLLPGREQKTVAMGLAWGYLAFSLLLVAGLQVAFDQWWAFQFSSERQEAYRAFLSPVQVGMALLPVIMGQAMQLYFCSQVLAQEKAVQGPGGQMPPAGQEPERGSESTNQPDNGSPNQ